MAQQHQEGRGHLFGDPRNIRICDLLVRGVPELVPTHARLSSDMVIRKIVGRWERRRPNLEQLMGGYIRGLGRFDDMAEPQHFVTYKQLMGWTAQHLAPRAQEWVAAAYRHEKRLKQDTRFDRAEHVMRLFAAPAQDMACYRQLAHEADAKHIDLNGYIPLVLSKKHRPLLALSRVKTIRSTLEKIARRLVSRTTEAEASTLLDYLGGRGRKKNEGDAEGILHRIVRDISANDGFGAGFVYSTVDEVDGALNFLMRAHKRGDVRIGYDRKGKDAVRDFIREQRTDGPSHAAVHVNIYPLSGGPDLFEVQLMTLDAFIVDIFDPEAGHLKYRHGRILRAQTEEITTADGRVVQQAWGKKQRRLYDALYTTFLSTYGQHITIN